MTDRQTHRRTWRLYDQLGQEGRDGENTDFARNQQYFARLHDCEIVALKALNLPNFQTVGSPVEAPYCLPFKI